MTDPSLTRTRLRISFLLCLLALGVYGMAYAVRIQRPGGALQFAVLATSNTPGNRGYDGQYYYRIAVDPPAGRRPVAVPGYPPVAIDRPAYRYQRIGYPLLARAAALGDRDRIAAALVLVNVAAIGLGTLFVALLLTRNGLSPLYAVAYAAYVGQAAGFWRDLAEPLATALIALALLLWRDDRPLLPTLVLLAAALTKETALLFAVPLALHVLLYRRWRAFVLVAGLVLLPYALWQLGLWAVFGQSGVGGADRPPFLPFGGLSGARTARQLLDLLLAIVLPSALCLGLAWCGMVRCRRRAAAREAIRTDQCAAPDNPAVSCVSAAPRDLAPNRSWVARLRSVRAVLADLPTLYLLANLAFVLWLPAHSYADLWASGRNAQTLVLAGLAHPALATTRLRRPLFALWACCAPLLWL